MVRGTCKWSNTLLGNSPISLWLLWWPSRVANVYEFTDSMSLFMYAVHCILLWIEFFLPLLALPHTLRLKLCSSEFIRSMGNHFMYFLFGFWMLHSSSRFNQQHHQGKWKVNYRVYATRFDLLDDKCIFLHRLSAIIWKLIWHSYFISKTIGMCILCVCHIRVCAGIKYLITFAWNGGESSWQIEYVH